MLPQPSGPLHVGATPVLADGRQLGEPVLRYALFAAAVVAAGAWLPFVGLDLAKAMGWSNTFVGTLFVALVTSVPEVVTTFAAALALANRRARRPLPAERVGGAPSRGLTQVKHCACARSNL